MPEESCTVYVGGLHYDASDPDLYDNFEKYGTVESGNFTNVQLMILSSPAILIFCKNFTLYTYQKIMS